jgi:hypothetical protein
MDSQALASFSLPGRRLTSQKKLRFDRSVAKKTLKDLGALPPRLRAEKTPSKPLTKPAPGSACAKKTPSRQLTKPAPGSVEPAAGKSPRTQRAKGSKPKEASRSKPPAGRVLPASRPKLRPARSDEQKHAEAKKFVDFFQQAPLTSELDEKFLAGLAACFIEIHWTFDLMLAVYKNAT